jgi:hypothetical protein
VRFAAAGAACFLGVVLASLPISPVCSAGPSAGPRVAPVLFLSSVPRPGLLDVARLHREGWDLLVAAMRDRGDDPVPRSAVEPLVIRWRVRTGLLLGPGFLDSLAISPGCSQVLVADLTLFRDRIVLAGRRTACDTRELLWSGVVEESLPAGMGRDTTETAAIWSRVLGAASRRLLESGSGVSARPAARRLFVLPPRRTGLDDAAAGIILQCLLRSLSGSGWRIEDPGVTCTRLREAGVDPYCLDRRAWPALTTGTGEGTILVCEAVASDPTASSGAVAPWDEDLPAFGQPPLPGFTLFVRWIDGTSGWIASAGMAEVAGEVSRGFFGTAQNLSPIRRVQQVTNRLVHSANQKG